MGAIGNMVEQEEESQREMGGVGEQDCDFWTYSVCLMQHPIFACISAVNELSFRVARFRGAGSDLMLEAH